MPCVFGRDPQTELPYPPHPTQTAVMAWAVEKLQHPSGGIPTLYVQHGVRAGGTRAILNVVCARLWHEPGLRVLIGRKDYQDLRLSVMETFADIWPRELIVEKDEQEHRYVVQGKDGRATVFFRELKDVRGLGSQEFGCISVHEAHEIEENAYRTLKQRSNQRGYPAMLLLEGNPPPQGHWLTEVGTPSSRTFDPDLTVMKMPSYENWANLDSAYKAMLEAQPSWYRRRFVDAEVGQLPAGSPVYSNFVDTLHSKPVALIPDKPLLRGWDFGWRAAACLWGQLTASGRLLLQHEWCPRELPEEEFLNGVVLRTNSWYGARAYRDIGDPAARNRDPNGVSTLQRLSAHGITLISRPSTYAERVPLINHRLSLLIDGEPAIVVDPAGCPILTEALLGGYHFPEIKPEERVLQLRKEVPEHDPYYSHVANAFEYLCVNLFLESSEAVKEFLARKRRHQAQVGRPRPIPMGSTF